MVVSQRPRQKVIAHVGSTLVVGQPVSTWLSWSTRNQVAGLSSQVEAVRTNFWLAGLRVVAAGAGPGRCQRGCGEGRK